MSAIDRSRLTNAGRLIAKAIDSLEWSLDCLETAQSLTATELQPLAESLAAAISKAWELLSLEQVSQVPGLAQFRPAAGIEPHTTRKEPANPMRICAKVILFPGPLPAWLTESISQPAFEAALRKRFAPRFPNADIHIQYGGNHTTPRLACCDEAGAVFHEEPADLEEVYRELRSGQ
jgi:hypothetical protein